MIAEIDDDWVEAAQNGDAAAAERLFASVLPGVTRLCIALCGSERSGKAAAKMVCDRSLKSFPRWRDGDEVDRWFVHQTIQFVRRVPQPKRIDDDVLFNKSRLTERPEYRAFLTTFRRSPHQQQEAFLLRHALRWNDRLLGVAMDCSLSAAQVHLRGMTDQLRLLNPELHDTLTTELVRTFARLPDEAPVSPASMGGRIGTRVTLRRVGALLRLTVLLAVIAGLAWLGWTVWPMIRT